MLLIGGAFTLPEPNRGNNQLILVASCAVASISVVALPGARSQTLPALRV